MANRSRRSFLRQAGGASILLGLGGSVAAHLSGSGTSGTEDAGSSLQLSPELLGYDDQLEPLIRKMIEVPEDRALQMLASELRKGVSPVAAMAALFHAVCRTSRFHHVTFVVHAAHEVAQFVEPRERLQPLFWSLYYMKDFQRRRRGIKPARRPRFDPPLRASEADPRSLGDALKRMDPHASERALLAIAATRGTTAAMDEMWQYGARDWTFIGHRAIAVANARRTLDFLGWQHAGACLRFVNEFMYSFDASNGDEQSYPANRERALTLHSRIPELAGSAPAVSKRSAHEATLELIRRIRAGSAEQSSAFAARQLSEGRISVNAVWDAVHVAGSELMMRTQGGDAVGGWPSHSVTAANSLQTAFESVSDPSTRLLILLQAVGWVAEFTRECVSTNRLRDLDITTFQPASIPDDPDAAAALVLETLEPGGGGFRKPRADPASFDAAAAVAFAYGLRFPEDHSLMRRTLRNASRTANTDAHDLKHPVAVFETVRRVSPNWRPHVLAALPLRVFSSKSPDSPAVQQMRQLI